MTLTPGTRRGVYDIAAQIGEGGMGQVFRATDTKLERQVAIKILPPSLAADHDRLPRFQRERPISISTTGGISPRWLQDGKELYDIAPDSTLIAVSTATTVGDTVTALITVVQHWRAGIKK